MTYPKFAVDNMIKGLKDEARPKDILKKFDADCGMGIVTKDQIYPNRAAIPEIGTNKPESLDYNSGQKNPDNRSVYDRFKAAMAKIGKDPK